MIMLCISNTGDSEQPHYFPQNKKTAHSNDTQYTDVLTRPLLVIKT